MINTIDGFNFDLPLSTSQIIALAQFHRKQLDEAILHNEIHLGNFCLGQRKRVQDFTKQLAPEQKNEFYHTYNAELERIADDDALHPPHAEAGVSAFVLFLTLGLIGFVLYFLVVRPTIA